MRRLGAGLLFAFGALWVVICFVGTAMMSRTVDFFTEAFLPSMLAVVPVAAGLYLLRRRPH